MLPPIREMQRLPLSPTRRHLLAPGWKLSADGYGGNRRKETKEMMFKAVIGNRQHEDYGVTPLMGRCRQVEPRMGGMV